MIRTSIKKILPTLLITYLVCFLSIFLYYQIFSPSVVMTGFQTSYNFSYSLLRFLDFLIPIHVTGLLLVYGLFITEDDLTSTRGMVHPFHQAVSPVLVFLLILVIGYTLLIAWTYSLTLRKVGEIEYKSELFDTYYTKALEAQSNHRQVEALQFLNQCLLLDGKSNKASKLYNEVQVYLLEHAELVEDSETGKEADFQEQGLDVESMVTRARQFFYKEDWFSAYYYASLAYQIDDNNLIAYELLHKALSRIEEHTLSFEDQRQQALYIRKKDGFDALKNGENTAAYYIFKELQQELPNDPDIALYLDNVMNLLKNDTFFVEDAMYPLSLPGIEDIFFKNPRDEDVQEYIFIGKMVQYDRGIYFQNIELIRMEPTGKVSLHFRAKYGKYMYADLPSKIAQTADVSVHNINVNGISKSDSSLEFGPEYLISDPGLSELKIFRILPDPGHLNWLSFREEKYRTLGIVELWNIKTYLALYGYPEKELNLEFLTRAILPFLFLIFSFFAIAVGWHFRSRYAERPPVVTILLFPLYPLLMSVICRLLIFTIRLVLTFFLFTFGFLPALIIGVVLLLLMLIVAMFNVAGQTTN